MTNLDMNATSSSRWGTVNTDGFDSWNSQDIVLRNWVVTCGDVNPPLPFPYSQLT
jgi:galacturan 1,4-alpha-galacturonidase